MTDPTLAKVYEALEEFTQSGALDKVGATASPASIDAGQDNGNVYMSMSDKYELQSRLITKSVPELHAIFADQANRKDMGVPLQMWLSGRNPAAFTQALQSGSPDAQLLVKAMDSTGAAPLIRQDLEPVLHALFVKLFPAWDRIRKVPANGLLHAWRKITSFGDAQFMPELGTVTDDNNTYEPAFTNVAILARRVGVSLKSQFAVQAGGMGWNLENEELTGGLRAMAHKMQKTIFQGNATASGGTASSEEGAYDANGFTGLRYLLRDRDTDADLSDTTFSDRDDIVSAINDATVSITNNGGTASVIYIRADEMNQFNKQQLPIVRIMDRTEFVPGIRVPAVATSAGDLPLVGIPGDSIGTYDYSGKESADIYVVDEGSLALPYLGSDGFTVLDIPIGVGGQLVHYFVIFGMFGLELVTDLFSAKVRAQLEP